MGELLKSKFDPGNRTHLACLGAVALLVLLPVLHNFGLFDWGEDLRGRAEKAEAEARALRAEAEVKSLSHGNAQASLVGRWKNTSCDEVVEFFPNGTYTCEGNWIPNKGTYTATAEGRLRLDITELGLFTTTRVWTYQVIGNRLLLAGNQSAEFERVK